MVADEDAGRHRMRVARALRSAREAAGLSMQQVADALDWSLSKQARIEGGSVSVSTTDLRALLVLLDIADSEHELTAAARAGRVRPWWQDLGVTATLGRFLAAEQDAYTLRSYHPSCLDGPLQTPAYTAALVDSFVLKGGLTPDRAALLTARRQERWCSASPAQATFAVDEAALYRAVGGREVMLAQLDHLLQLIEHPQIALRVLPFAAPAFFLEHPLVLLDLPDGGAVAFLEGVTEDHLLAHTHPAYAEYQRLLQGLLDTTLTGPAARKAISRARSGHANAPSRIVMRGGRD